MFGAHLRRAMPLFALKGDDLAPVAQVDFTNEKALQTLVEKNLKAVFNSRFVATEFKTGAVHAGRIDTLALSEDGNPVIIEYKKVASSELINQSLYYLSWIKDHHGDFEIAAQKTLGKNVEIDWTDVRVICLAPNYKKYDLYAVQVMGANIELWTYKRFSNGTLYIEEQYKRGTAAVEDAGSGKNPVMVEAGKKAAITKATASWTFEQHLEGRPEKLQELALAVQEFMIGLDPAIEEDPKKYYVAYRTSQNIVCMEVQKQKILLFLKLDPEDHKGPPGISRDMRQLGHYGTGDLEIAIKTEKDLDAAKPFIKLAYDQVGA
jgi:predicted transport protein